MRGNIDAQSIEKNGETKFILLVFITNNPQQICLDMHKKIECTFTEGLNKRKTWCKCKRIKWIRRNERKRRGKERIKRIQDKKLYQKKIDTNQTFWKLNLYLFSSLYTIENHRVKLTFSITDFFRTTRTSFSTQIGKWLIRYSLVRTPPYTDTRDILRPRRDWTTKMCEIIASTWENIRASIRI